jgi:hypothetical protein
VLDAHFEAAAAHWKEILMRTHPAADELPRILLAWALLETSRFEEARTLLETWPIPRPSGETSLMWLTFPRSVYLKARALDHAGRKDEARALYELFLRLAGDGLPREAAKAREALGR